MSSLKNSKQLYITTPAKQDLQNISTYTQETWGTKQKTKYMKKLKCCFDDICFNTTMGKHYHDIDSTLLSFHSQKHIIFYRLISNEIRIIRVLHQSMDIEAQLTGK